MHTASARLAQELYARDPQAHLADIGVLKSDAIGLQPRPEVRDAIAPLAGYLPAIDLETLRALPPNTFGHAYARFLDDHGLSVFRLTDAVPADVRARQTYGIRYATTHDMFHVLLGYGPDWVGEMGVLAFAVGQRYGIVVTLQACAAWIVYPVRSGFDLAGLRAAWRRGTRLGAKAPNLLAIRLADRFTDDLGDVRRDLGLD